MPQQQFSAGFDLLERDAELAALDRLIRATETGAHLLAPEGPPGIGKTALIAEAKALAQEAGMQVLGARGSELERSFSSGVVRQLFELPVDGGVLASTYGTAYGAAVSSWGVVVLAGAVNPSSVDVAGLLQALAVRAVTLANRIVMSPMPRNFSLGGVPIEDVAA